MQHKNGIKNAIIPALLLQLCSGTCYCFSIYRTEISEILSCGNGAIGWLFTTVIFFLGLFAAFSGKMVEKNVHTSSLLASILLPVGMIVVAIALSLQSYIIAMIGFCIMGSGVGLSYICPVKTLAIWYRNNKGLATSISIASFGLSKTLFSPIMEWLQNTVGTINMFWILAFVFFIAMYIGHLLLAKPIDWVEKSKKENVNLKSIIFNKTFFVLFITFLISISNGLYLIGLEKQLLIEHGVATIGLICAITAIFNCLGRILFSWLTDKLSYKFNTYLIMAVINCIISSFICLKANLGHSNAIETIIFLCVINATYGGYFASLVPIIADLFGLKYLSTIHSCELVAWSLGAVISALLLQFLVSFNTVLVVMTVLYIISLIISVTYCKITKKEV